MVDFLGREIRPGQDIVYAVTQGRRAALRRGTVVATLDGRLTVLISTRKWTRSGYVIIKRVVTLQHPNRCIVID